MKEFLYDSIKFIGISIILMFAHSVINLFVNLDYGTWAFGLVVWHSFITHDNPIKKIV